MKKFQELPQQSMKNEFVPICKLLVAGKSCNHRRRKRSFSAARRLKAQWLKKGPKQPQGEKGQTLKVNETRENYDAAVHGYTVFVTNPFFVQLNY